MVGTHLLFGEYVMARKFKEKFLKPSFETSGHIWVGTVWPVTGSKGDQYSVELTDHGFKCDCMGFPWHGRCKHSKAVLQKVESAIA